VTLLFVRVVFEFFTGEVVIEVLEFLEVLLLLLHQGFFELVDLDLLLLDDELVAA